MAVRMLRSFVIVFVLSALPASAQSGVYSSEFFAQLQLGTPVDGRPGCSWQWARDTVGPWGGWYQACVAPGLVPAAVPAVDECDRPLNPYTPEGAELGARCAARGITPPAGAPLQMRVGGRYEQAYSDLQMIVLAVVADIGGREVVVCQWAGESARQRPTHVFILADEERGMWRQAASWSRTAKR